MTLAAFLLALAGFGALATASPRLRSRTFARWSAYGRAGGFALLGASLLVRLGTPHWRISLVEWVGELTAAALVVMLIAMWRARYLPRLVLLALIGAMFAIVV